MRIFQWFPALMGLSCLTVAQSTLAWESSGQVLLQQSAFFHDNPATENYQWNSAVSSEIELFHTTEQSQWVGRLFGRLDQHDSAKNHLDLAELYWLYYSDDWEVQLGVAKVFWGVTESQHLVDIVNQTDQLEGIDGEDKLGQPMLRWSKMQDWGTVDLFLLPYFRPQAFASADSRPATVAVSEQEHYESAAERQHLDYAIRWKHAFDVFDLSLSYFDGTQRNPTLLWDQNTQQLQPYYAQLQQLGFTGQATVDAWLWKLEMVSRHVNDQSYFASVAGFEYTLYGLFDSAQDLGLLWEYHFDDRKRQADAIFNNDSMFGARWALNDEDSTEALLGIIIDHDTQTRLTSLEASTRLNDHWKIELEGRWYHVANNDPLLQSLAPEDNVQFTLGYYF